ncbi:MAG: GNAT family N-acetyltransferase [Candidatus Eremiobacteraeota bacterium]|nr:GNAT family N-acetyltransferase [Candidatus Eremiobacteraeota bacterium]
MIGKKDLEGKCVKLHESHLYEIEKMIVYSDSLKGVTADRLQGFFHGWPTRPSPENHLEILRHSDFVVSAVDNKTGNIVGFITAISDGILCAYVPLLEVLPHYQRKGIGSRLVKLMLEKLKHLYMIDIICDKNVRPFYQKLGMTEAGGMIKRNYENLSGIPLKPL